MKNREVVRYKQQLDDLFEKINILPEDSEIRSHWARYLCVRVSGFLEVSVRAIYGQYADNKTSPFVANYVKSQLSSFQNPNMEKILNISRAFNPAWAERLEEITEGEIRDAIISIVNARHSIAHGGATGITYSKISNYYKSAIKLVELLEKQCDGDCI